jgi:hypothetical protein
MSARAHIWAESYDRESNGVLSLPDELAQMAVNQAKVALNLLLFSGFRGSLDIQQMQYGCGGGKFHRFLVVGHCQFCGLK